MSGAHEMLEKMEHAGHAGHGGHGHGDSHGPGKAIGITMALLGVMLAFCAAMVGSARTELIKATVEQANLWSIYQAESTKYRVMEADFEMLHALTPNKAEIKKFEERLSNVKRAGGKADDEDTAELKEAIHVATVELAEVLTPDRADEDRIGALAAKYKRDMHEAKEDAEAYDDAIEAQHHASEWYERAQLCAEIGIVIASIALLLSSRPVWLLSVLIGVGGAGIVGYTFQHTHSLLIRAEAKIEEAKKKTAEIEADDEKDDDGDGIPNRKEGPGEPKDEHGGAAGHGGHGEHGEHDKAHAPEPQKPEPHEPEKGEAPKGDPKGSPAAAPEPKHAPTGPEHH